MADGLLIRIGADARQALETFKQVGTAASGFASNVGSKLGNAFEGLKGSFSSFKTAASNAFSGAASAITSFINPTQLAVVAVTSVGVALLEYATKASNAEVAQRALNKAMEDGRASVQGEVTDLHALVSIAGDETLSRDARGEAIRKLNKDYPDTFKNLRLDATLTDRLAAGERTLTEELVRQARVKALIRLIDQAEEKKVTAKAAPIETLTFWDKLFIGVKSFNTAALAGANTVIAAQENVNDTIRQQDAIIKEATKSLLTLRTEQAKAGTLFTDKAIKIKAPKIEKPKLEKEKFIFPAQLNLKFFKGPKELVEEDLKNLDISGIFKNLKAAVGHFGLAGISLEKSLEAKEASDKVLRLNANIQTGADIVTNGLAPAFESVFASIGEGGVSAFQALGNAIKQIITRLLAAAAAAAVVSALLQAFFPGKDAAGGSFLGGFKNIFGQLSGFKFASGGIATKATLGIFGEREPEAVIPLSQLPRIASMISGGGSQVFIAEHRLEGSTIVTSYRRETGRLGGTFS